MNDSVRKKAFVLAVALLLIVAGQPMAESKWWEKGADLLKSVNRSAQSSGPTVDEIGRAFKDALRIGSAAVVQRLGAVDGFNADPAVHIPLPEKLQTVKTVLSRVGMSQMVDDLERKLNRAAEAAAPRAKGLFQKAIGEMTFEDVQKIYDGPDDSATAYFREKMSPGLREEMRPIVDDTLSEVGAIRAYETVIGQYQSLPFVPDVSANLSDHVVENGMDGIFHYMAEEEAAIRKDPLKQTTALLQKVFGAR